MDHSEVTTTVPRKARTSANVTKAGPESIVMSAKQIKRAISLCLGEMVACAIRRVLL